MTEFDSLKNIWQQEEPQATNINISKGAQSDRIKMQRHHFLGSVFLFLTGVFIGALALWGNLNFQQWYTYGGMVLIILICWAQAAFIYSNYAKMRQINASAAPSEHLKQWEAYYLLRQRQNRWNGPLYFIALNVAMGVYLYEIMYGRPVLNVLLMLSIYFGWILYAYFILGKRVLRKENQRLQTIIQELKALENQFEKE